MKITIPTYGDYDKGERIELPRGLYAIVRVIHDDDTAAPWKEHDGYGIVSDWRALESKRPGERVLNQDRGRARFYDFAATVERARKDVWGSAGDEGLKPGAKAARAVESDFQRMRAWCNDEWHWIGVATALYAADGARLGAGALWGIESDGDYWREVAAEQVTDLYATEKKRQRDLTKAYLGV